MVKLEELFNINNDLIGNFFKRYSNPLDIISNIHDYILEIGKTLDKEKYHEIKENVWVADSSQVESNVEIIGPAIIMENTTLRHNAYIRENVIIGPNSLIGNASEIKNSVLLGNNQIPHFNYVGDSLLGNFVHLGAGVIVANLRLDKQNVKVEKEATALRKLGSFIGDNTEIGCNSVVYPGTIVMKNSMIYPLSIVKNVYPDSSIRPERI